MSRLVEEYRPVIFYEGEDKTPIDRLSVSANGKNFNVSYSSPLYIKEGRLYTPIGTLMSLHNNSSKTDLITASGRVIGKFNNLANKIFIKIPQMKSSYVNDREDDSWALRNGEAFRGQNMNPGKKSMEQLEKEELMEDDEFDTIAAIAADSTPAPGDAVAPGDAHAPARDAVAPARDAVAPARDAVAPARLPWIPGVGNAQAQRAYNNFPWDESGGRRRRKSRKSRKTSNKKRKSRKQIKSKRRRTKKNKIRPIIYGGASIKQYGIASALRSLIFTYFPQNRFSIINLSPRSLDKYELTNSYTTVMDLLNQIVHNDDGRAALQREVKFGDFLKYSSVLDNVLSDIISDIKNYLHEQFKLNKINSNDNAIILNSITNIENEFPKEAKKAELPASASAQGVIPDRKRISVASIFSKVSHDRQSKYPLMCEYLRNKFPEKPSGRLSIIFDFFENAPMSKEDLAEILDLFKQNLKAGYIGSEYESEIRYLQEEIDKK